ncbi:MAG: restriction endonuclease, partial [Alcaligenaceae bacterium]
AGADTEKIVKAIVINGWADFIEKSTGKTKSAFCSSIFATTAQIAELNFRNLDPEIAFMSFKGITSKSTEVVPIAPVMQINKDDPRFVEAKEVIDQLNTGENLAAMDWEDFEHLCRELFERAFADTGAEVKVTQASRDQGIDAVIFDPDPIKGGKIVVQAKRYTNTVDVSAVRDLYGSLMNEGAMKGILVTTSHFGPDAYSFAQGKPIVLLNGSQLLGLLQNYGYNFRINIDEAKRLAGAE